ncbi:MAG: TolC family protein [Pseudomonadota bacterium]
MQKRQQQVVIGMVIVLLGFLTPQNCIAEQEVGSETPGPTTGPPGRGISLEKAIDLALINNPDLRIASERIGLAEAQFGEALAAFYPQIKARVGYEHTNNPALVFSHIVAQRRFSFGQNINNPGSTENFRPEIVGALSLYRGGQDYQRSKAAELEVETAELEHQSVRNNLVEAVTATYYAMLAARENQLIADRSIRAVQSELNQAHIRHHAGAALMSDVLSLEVQLAEAQNTEIRAANAVELTLAGMKTLLGLTAEEPLRFADNGDPAVPTLNMTFEELLDQALKQRPEMAIAANRVASRERERKAARGAHLPRADAYVSYGQNNRNPGFSSQKDNVTASIAVEVDLFSGFRSQERVRAAERKLEQAREAQRRTRLLIEREVKTAYLGVREALDRVRVTETSVAAAEEALRLVTEQLRAGTVTVSRYIDAETARDSAHARAIAARYDALRAEAKLNRALGTRK